MRTWPSGVIVPEMPARSSRSCCGSNSMSVHVSRLAFITLEQVDLRVGNCLGHRQPYMSPGPCRQYSTAGRALDEALLDLVGPDDVFDRVTGLRQSCGNRLDAHRATTEVLGDHVKVAPIELAESQSIHVKTGQCCIRNAACNEFGASYCGEVTHPPQQPAGDARRTPRPSSDFLGTFIIERQSQDACAPRDDQLQFADRIKIERSEERRVGKECRSRRSSVQ